MPSHVCRRMICNGQERPRALAFSRSWKSPPISWSSRSSASLSSPSPGPGSSSCSRLLGPGADDDAASPAFGERPGGADIQIRGFADGRLDVGLRELTELAFGDLAHQRVVEQEIGSEAGLRAEAWERQEQVLLARFGFFRVDRGPASFQPAPQSIDG